MLLRTPRFDFRMLVESHGWVHLAPFRWHARQGLLERPMRCAGEVRSIQVHARQVGRETRVHVQGYRRGATDDLRRQVRRMLRLDEDLSPFHTMCRGHRTLDFVARRRCGGLLRSPTAFEDLVKTICTTNVAWAQTKRMVERLCQLGEGEFPGPAVLADMSERRLAALTGVGYRARSIIAAARAESEGELSLEELAARGEVQEIRQRLAGLWGVGDYSVKHMLMLLGFYHEIPVDSEVTAYLRRTHFQRRPMSPSAVARHFGSFGAFAYLAYKFERVGRRENYTDNA